MKLTVTRDELAKPLCMDCGGEFERTGPRQVICRDCAKSRRNKNWRARRSKRPRHYRAKDKKRFARHSRSLSDSYVKKMVSQRTCIRFSEIPEDLVDLMRAYLSLRRARLQGEKR